MRRASDDCPSLNGVLKEKKRKHSIWQSKHSQCLTVDDLHWFLDIQTRRSRVLACQEPNNRENFYPSTQFDRSLSFLESVNQSKRASNPEIQIESVRWCPLLCVHRRRHSWRRWITLIYQSAQCVFVVYQIQLMGRWARSTTTSDLLQKSWLVYQTHLLLLRLHLPNEEDHCRRQAQRYLHPHPQSLFYPNSYSHRLCRLRHWTLHLPLLPMLHLLLAPVLHLRARAKKTILSRYCLPETRSRYLSWLLTLSVLCRS